MDKISKTMLGNFINHYAQKIEEMRAIKQMLTNSLPNIFNQLAIECFNKEDCEEFNLKTPLHCFCNSIWGAIWVTVWQIILDTDTPNEDKILLVCSETDEHNDDMYIGFDDIDNITQLEIIKQLAQELNIDVC